MQTRFYLSRGGQNSGPWTLDEIALRLAKGEIAPTDFLYDDAQGAWIPCLESKPLMAVIRASAPLAPPPGAERAVSQSETQVPVSARDAADASDEDETPDWLVKRGPRVYGPFTFWGLIRALQEKSIFEFDLVRKGPEGASGPWARIAEHGEFQADRIRELAAAARQKDDKRMSDAFLARRFQRKPIEQDAIVHDNQKTWIGRTYQGSEAGCGIVIRNALLAPGQAIHVHFGSRDGLPAFNALCEVVSKRFRGDVRDARAPVQYGLKYLQIDPRAVQAARAHFSK